MNPLGQGRGSMFARVVKDRLHGGCQIGPAEVVALEQQRLTA